MSTVDDAGAVTNDRDRTWERPAVLDLARLAPGTDTGFMLGTDGDGGNFSTSANTS